MQQFASGGDSGYSIAVTTDGSFRVSGSFARGQSLCDAILSYRRALEVQPYYAEAHNNLGQAYEAVGELKRAEMEYRTAVEVDSSLAPAWYNLAISRERSGDRLQALTAYDRALELLSMPDWLEHPESTKFKQKARMGKERLGR
mgnify:CR=1 FL=1